MLFSQVTLFFRSQPCAVILVSPKDKQVVFPAHAQLGHAPYNREQGYYTYRERKQQTQ